MKVEDDNNEGGFDFKDSDSDIEDELDDTASCNWGPLPSQAPSTIAFESKIKDLDSSVQILIREERSRIKELEKENERLRYTVVKPPPAPTSKPVEVKSFKDLKAYALSFPKYSIRYFNGEGAQNAEIRIELWAFLSLISDASKKNGVIENPARYINYAVKKSILRAQSFAKQADKEGVSLASWINNNINF